MNRLLIATALFIIVPCTAWADLDLPVNGSVTSGVGWRVDPFGSGRLIYHRGIDIAVPVGTPVHATRTGRVIFAGIHGGHGATVIVEHENGDRTLYGHNSSLSVRTGELIEAGTVIAFSGNSGRSTGPHVHYEMLPGDRPIMHVAQAEKATKPGLATDEDIRLQQERRMEETVNSILRKISGFSIPSGSAGQGG